MAANITGNATVDQGGMHKLIETVRSTIPVDLALEIASKYGGDTLLVVFGAMNAAKVPAINQEISHLRGRVRTLRRSNVPAARRRGMIRALNTRIRSLELDRSHKILGAVKIAKLAFSGPLQDMVANGIDSLRGRVKQVKLTHDMELNPAPTSPLVARFHAGVCAVGAVAKLALFSLATMSFVQGDDDGDDAFSGTKQVVKGIAAAAFAVDMTMTHGPAVARRVREYLPF